MTRGATVTVFGSGACPPKSPLYANARQLGGLLAGAGYIVATGGYTGVMEATSLGAHEAGGHVVGVTCDRIQVLRGTGANAWVKETVHFATLRERLYHLIHCAAALVVMPGGVGTLGEVAAAWNGMQTHEIPARPLVLVGPGWRSTLVTFCEEMDGLIAPHDIERLTFVAGVEEVVPALDGRI